jgi:redox-sensitive bicupin YhaK (pirin superfamily)
MTSAGTGISHSEYNRNNSDPVHFLQIWVQPSASRLIPKYYTRHFTDEEKKDKLVQIVAPLLSSKDSKVVDEREGAGPVPIHAPVSVYASILSPATTVEHSFTAPAPGESLSKAYIHVIQTSGYNAKNARSKSEGGARVIVNGGLELGEGDGAFAMGSTGDKWDIENIGEGDAELLVFDIE